MADEPKKTEEAPSTATSPAPTEVAEGGKGAPPPPDPNSKIQAEPLADGTVPTVLKPGETHRSITKGKTGLGMIYRRADVMTTLITFVAAAVAGGLILGGYAYFTRSKAKAPTATPKVTKLDTSDLNKLNAFFNGNSAGKPAEVLTINSSSLFLGRVAVSSDLKVTGGLDVDGTTNLGNLNATKTTTLGVTNVGGALTINGPLTVQNPALFHGGASFGGNLTSTGSATFGGALSAGSITVHDLSVGGTLNLNGHLNIGGSAPSVSTDRCGGVGGLDPCAASGTGASATVQGSDAAGTVSITTGTVSPNSNLGGTFVKVIFHDAYPSAPTIVISGESRDAASLQPYVLKSSNSFIIGTTFDALSHHNYAFDYWVAQ
jgi:hypothetical protein